MLNSLVHLWTNEREVYVFILFGGFLVMGLCAYIDNGWFLHDVVSTESIGTRLSVLNYFSEHICQYFSLAHNWSSVNNERVLDRRPAALHTGRGRKIL